MKGDMNEELCPEYIRILYNCLKNPKKNGIFLQEWKKGSILLLYKREGKPINKATSYRPINPPDIFWKKKG